MTLAAFWDGDWQFICTEHDTNSTDPAAWLGLATAQRLLGFSAVAALAASRALGATDTEIRESDRVATLLLLAQSLLLSDSGDAAISLIQQALPPSKDPVHQAKRVQLLQCSLLLLVGDGIHYWRIPALEIVNLEEGGRI
jgi:hypothetical protein